MIKQTMFDMEEKVNDKYERTWIKMKPLRRIGSVNVQNTVEQIFKENGGMFVKKFNVWCIPIEVKDKIKYKLDTMEDKWVNYQNEKAKKLFK